MKSLALAFALVLAPAAARAQAPAATAAPAPHGVVREGLAIRSPTLGRDVRYTVYLPPDYAASERAYPVVYLLHGFGDDDTGWVQFGEAHLALDAAIARREVPPMILVMPDGGTSWYVDNHDGSVRWAAFFTDELIPQVEQTFRIRRDRRYRGVAGLSMGGHGALVHALKRPDLFSAAAALSAGVLTDAEVAATPDDRWAGVFGAVYGAGRQGEARLTAHYRQNAALPLARAGDPEALRRVRWWIDCGDDDFLTAGNAALHVLLRERGVPHEYRVRDGGHVWAYWRSGLVPALQFIGEGFHQP